MTEETKVEAQADQAIGSGAAAGDDDDNVAQN